MFLRLHSLWSGGCPLPADKKPVERDAPIACANASSHRAHASHWKAGAPRSAAALGGDKNRW